MPERKRRLKSIKSELLIKSREAMLSAVQIFNNPNINFKSENFIILSNIAWMYLLHAYYREKSIEYRYFKKIKTRRRFDRTKRGAYKYWELERCLTDKLSPIDKVTSSNLKFLIGLRHEIEHQMTDRIDEYLSARFQSCCLNYNLYIKKLFGEQFAIDKHLSISLQFSTINEEQTKKLKEFTDLPKNIATYINDFDENLSDELYNDIRFSYRVLYVPKSANRKGQADKVIEFIPANSPEAKGLNKEYVLIKEKERKKFLPKHIKELMIEKGFSKFSIHKNTLLWKENDAKDPKKNFGVNVEDQWYWYDNWVKFVENYCIENKEQLN
ncbi:MULTISPECIES: DUF3644 domain-containing protein [Flavobacteriaceae]|uniref:DUF3644 domain-containing protein n=2 Tax=Flavobacteriaceae TaxID=49546 RepID=A0A4Y8ATK0_9FLAO|nr:MULTISPECIES: DUF3644 domain-containing protein [Flavobacteriaceae]TEW74119.1 DUF3644 domain-containing protein [Gramella jeungdoensis]GGK40451.1 hypothetical protein GCM10007963_05640 [Lutibacter litoralis]